MLQVIDQMIKVPDAASYASIHFLDRILDRKCGGSTGTNLYGAFQVMADMHQRRHDRLNRNPYLRCG